MRASPKWGNCTLLPCRLYRDKFENEISWFLSFDCIRASIQHKKNNVYGQMMVLINISAGNNNLIRKTNNNGRFPSEWFSHGHTKIQFSRSGSLAIVNRRYIFLFLGHRIITLWWRYLISWAAIMLCVVLIRSGLGHAEMTQGCCCWK